MLEPISALLVDDEPLARANLRHALAGFPRWRVAAECAGAAEARAALAVGPVDVLFLDIRMPRESGLALARSVAVLERPPILVFVTAYESFAVEAFELHALDYLLKPFDDERFRQAIERTEEVLDLRQRAAYAEALRSFLADTPEPPPPSYLSRLSVRSVGRIQSVAVADLLWVTSAGNYARLHLAGRSVLHRVTLTLLERRLDPGQFLRVHRTALVRREECRSLAVAGDGVYTLHLQSGASVPVSERHVAEVRALLATG